MAAISVSNLLGTNDAWSFNFSIILNVSGEMDSNGIFERGCN
jgi:hypothetical protein